MARVLLTEECKLQWPDLTGHPHLPLEEPDRTPGVHLSGVLKPIGIATGHLNVHESDPDDCPLIVAMGMAWERWYFALLAKEYKARGLTTRYQPGETCLDNIYMTPDGLSTGFVFGEERQWVEECKVTKKSIYSKGSSPEQILDQKMWLWQIACYGHALGTDIACLHVLWVNGNYRPAATNIQKMRYWIQFEDGEQERIWNQLILPNVCSAVKEKPRTVEEIIEAGRALVDPFPD